MESLLKYKEAAEILGVCDRTVWSLVKKGLLKSVKFGRSVRITHEAIKDFIKKSSK